MGLFSDIWASVKATINGTDFTGYDALFNAQVSLSMKTVALDTCTTYLARLVSKGDFVYKENDSIAESQFDYLLNVKPNPNQTASEFKVAMVKKILDGELLVINVDGYFYIADNFVTVPMLSGNTYTGVTINFSSDSVANAPNSGPFAQKYFQNVFTQGVNCFHLSNDNEGINDYVNTMWEDYGRLFGILVTNQLRVGQLRAKLSIPVSNKLEDDERVKEQKQYSETLSKRLLSDPVVFIPDSGKAKSAYDEVSASKASNIQNQITDFGNLKKIFITEISGLLGIPPALVLGETANNSENLDLAIESAVIPIANKISEGFISLLLKQSGYSSGKTIELTGFKTINILDRADAIDKVGSSGIVKINEVREASGLSPLPDGDKVIMTKNYEEKGNISENT